MCGVVVAMRNFFILLYQAVDGWMDGRMDGWMWRQAGEKADIRP